MLTVGAEPEPTSKLRSRPPKLSPGSSRDRSVSSRHGRADSLCSAGGLQGISAAIGSGNRHLRGIGRNYGQSGGIPRANRSRVGGDADRRRLSRSRRQSYDRRRRSLSPSSSRDRSVSSCHGRTDRLRSAGRLQGVSAAIGSRNRHLRGIGRNYGQSGGIPRVNRSGVGGDATVGAGAVLPPLWAPFTVTPHPVNSTDSARPEISAIEERIREGNRGTHALIKVFSLQPRLLYRFHCYCELSGMGYVQLFLTEKPR